MVVDERGRPAVLEDPVRRSRLAAGGVHVSLSSETVGTFREAEATITAPAQPSAGSDWVATDALVTAFHG